MNAQEWGIPMLDLAMQAESLPAPVVKWGTVARGLRAPSFHFYCNDYAFTRLWYDPSRLFLATPEVIVEPNFSTYKGMARAEALWQIYRKRWIARAAQQQGIKVIVDLNVEDAFRDLALLGVPHGWNAYATRIHRSVRFAQVEADFAQAAARAGRFDPLFIVFGGGQRIQVACRERGWPWVPEHRQVVKREAVPYGQG